MHEPSRHLRTIDGDATRWTGVILFVRSGALRLWPVFVLGRRFGGLVGIQRDDTRGTTGVYRYVRNPSYLRLLISAFGWSRALHAAFGILQAVPESTAFPLGRRAAAWRKKETSLFATKPRG